MGWGLVIIVDAGWLPGQTRHSVQYRFTNSRYQITCSTTPLYGFNIALHLRLTEIVGQTTSNVCSDLWHRGACRFWQWPWTFRRDMALAVEGVTHSVLDCIASYTEEAEI